VFAFGTEFAFLYLTINPTG